MKKDYQVYLKQPAANGDTVVCATGIDPDDVLIDFESGFMSLLHENGSAVYVTLNRVSHVIALPIQEED